MTRKIVSVLLWCLVLVPGRGFSQTKADVRGFDSSVLDYHFSKADRELSPEAWMTEARRGLSAAMTGWELVAADLYGDPLLAEEARKELRRWSEEELEERFTQWLFRCFFGGEAEALAEKLSGLIGETHLQYTYHRDEEGNILYDDKTGDPLVIRPSDGRDFDQDREHWREAVEGGLRKELGKLEEHIALRFPELLAYVSQDRREDFAEKIQTLYAKVTFTLQREFEGLVNREERLFTARRTGDLWSLRKKSDEEAAGEITARLIDEAEAVCAGGAASLAGRIEEAAAGTGDLALAGAEWLEMYREQFERGLKAWEDAEERFFIRRIEWEQEAGKTWQEGEDAWQLAFNQFENAWRAWELQAKELFESGEALFKNASDNLERAIREAKLEFEQDAQLRTGAGSARARAWVDMYITSGSVAAAARENIQYWLKKYPAYDAPELLDGRFEIWFNAELVSYWEDAEEKWERTYGYQADLTELQKLKTERDQAELASSGKINETDPQKKAAKEAENAARLRAAQNAYEKALADFQAKHALLFEIQQVIEGTYDDDQRAVLVEALAEHGIYFGSAYQTFLEIQRWFRLYEFHMAKALESREMLVTEFQMVMGTGALADILRDTAVSEDFNLDEYQIELIRAKAAAAYWEKRVVIAREVSAYAEELGAGRMTDAEGVRAWEAAKAAYDEAVLAYEAEQETLSAAGAELMERETVLNAAAEKVREADEKLKHLNQQYASLMAVYAVGRGDYLLEELKSKYQALLDQYNLSGDQGPAGAYIRYFERSMALGFAQNREEAGEALKKIIAGNGHGEKSLAKLRAEAENITIPAEDKALPVDISEYGLAEDSPYYTEIRLLMTDRDRLIAAAAEDSEADPELAGMIRNHYDKMIRLQVTAAKAAAEKALEIRMLGLRIFTAPSGADWYFGARHDEPGTEEKAALLEEGLARRLAADEEQSSLALLEARLSLETAALEYVVNGEPAAGEPEYAEAEFLSFFCGAGTALAEQGLALLKSLRERMTAGTGLFTGDDEENALIQWFITGGSFFSGTGVFLQDPSDEYALSQGLLEMYKTYGHRAAFAEKETWNQTLDNLKKFFTRWGLESADVPFPDIQNAGNRFFDGDGDMVSGAAEFLADLDQQFVCLPGALEPELQSWKNSFIEYMAARALYSGRTIKDTAFVQGQRNELQEQFAAFGEAYQNLTFLDEETAKELNRAYEDFLKRERILSYSYEIAGAYEHMVQARLDAEAEGQKHWRQFITIIPASGAASAQGAASSWNEGVFLDALERAARNTEGLNIFLTRCAGEIAGAEDAELKSLAASYLLDPAKLWDEGLITRTLYLVLDDFYTAAGNVQRYKTSEELIREEISSLGRAYDIFIKGSEAVKKELAGELEKISAQEELIKNLGTAYSLAAEDFAGSGAVYDHLYSGLKESYADMEEKRFLYEIQDAIRRWASTAYLEADTGDAEYCADRFERALIVLEAVSDLYHQNEERRPYENSSYEAIYQKYQESFSRMIASMKVQEELNKAIAEEIQRNTASYNYYRSQLDAFGKPLEYAAGYTAPSSPAEWSYRDFLTVKNGRLGFSYNSSFVLQGINQSGSNTMRNYFSREHKSVSGTETNAASDYETALRELDRRMLSYFSDSRKYQQWGLARDYLIRKLLEMNPGVSCLQGAYSPAGELKQGGSLGGLKPKALQLVGLDPDYYIWKYDQLFQDDLSAMQKRAWENMSAGERADLEFYIVLTLFDDAGRVKNTGFSQLSAVEEFKNAQDLAQSSYESSRKRADMWWFFGFLYYGTRDENKAILDRVNGMLEQTEKNVDQWQTYLNGRLSGVSSSLSSYLYSCNRLSALQGKKTDGQSVSWNDIRTSLSAMGSVTDREMELLRDSWEMMNRDIGGTYQNVSSAIARLTQWTRSDNEDNKRDLEYQWNRDALDRQEKENNYLAYVNAFIAGEGDAQGLKEMAALAFGKNAAARKNHLENLEEVIIKDLAGVMVNGSEYPVEYHDLANSYASLISRAYRMRYEAELAARETEWAQQREDINEKYRLWQETAGLILERGREAWKTGNQKMAEAYRQWAEDYSSEYHRISGAWAAAYLAGLEDKETWLAGAAAAAEKASSRALLNLIGADAEMMARTMDTRDPAAMSSRYTTVAAEDLLKSLLDTAGISGLSQALASINGMADTAVRQVRRGTGGLNVWNSGAAQAAAMNLARETNAELAAREAKRLAADAQAAASEAIRGLAKTVDNANGNFREKMDEIFIMRGFWRGDGKNYIRDIFVHSTVFQPVITEQATVQGYVNYQMEPVEIKTNVSESYLSGLNAFAIQGLIENVHKEVETATKKIFGDDGEENTIIKAKGLDGYTPVFETDEVNGTATITWIERWIDLKDREQSPGKFGAHIGYAPAQREDVKEVTRRTLFYDEGAGELGRLLADFIYWQAMDSVGTGKIASAVWDKPLWDSRSSIFDAPSIRTITDIGLQVVTGVISMAAAPFTGGASALAMMGVMTAISVTDDLVFNTLDAVGGYKTWDEAGFAFGKAVLISAASNAVSGVFNGVSGVSGGFFAQGAGLTGITAGAAGSAAGKAVVQTAMKGMETITSTLVTSALNGVTYSRNGGWGYSTETFFQGVEGLPSSLLSGMTSTFTTGMMNRGLEGFTKSLYVDGTKLSGLAGSLAGQGVNYAMGGDFSMNLFNLGLVSQGKINSGLLELHLGRDGVRMNLGTGGADVSLGSLMAAARGLEAWAVNLDLLTSKEDAARKYASQMRTLYSGSETNKDEYLAILAGRTKILENPDVKETESKVDESTGVKNIALGQNALNDTSRFGLNVYFSHESYRDGLDNGAEQQAVERDNAVAGHINTAIDLMQTYGAGSIGTQMALEANLFSFAGNNGITGLQRTIFDAYDSSGDFWKLTEEGNLMYDGFATLRDANDNIIKSYRSMGLSSDNSIEGALLYLLGISSGDTEKVAAVRKMMEDSGLLHSFAINPDNWYWKGEHTAAVGSVTIEGRGDLPILISRDLEMANMGKTISFESINSLLTMTDANGTDVQRFLERTYGTAINFLNCAEVGANLEIANLMLSKYYNPDQLAMIQVNRGWFNNVLKNGINISTLMVVGPANRSQEFDVTSEPMHLSTSPVKNAATLVEDHPGIDHGRGGIQINTPGGYWEVVDKNDHRAYYQLYGGDLKMRVMHIDPEEIKKLQKNSVFGSATGTVKLLNYPTESYGSGTGAHTHIDMTRFLPYNGYYTRQFVNPETLYPGSRLDYYLKYSDIAGNILQNTPYNRY